MWTGVAEDSRDEVAKPPPHSAELFDFNAAGEETEADAAGGE